MRHFLTQDNDGHWYVVPVDKATEWADWIAYDIDSAEAPAFARSVGGSPSLVTFSDFTIGY